MYKSVLIKEAKDLPATNSGDAACGNVETTIKYRDPDTKEWRCARASDKWIEDILKPALGIADSASYLDRILKHGTTTGVFDDSMTIGHPSSELCCVVRYRKTLLDKTQSQIDNTKKEINKLDVIKFIVSEEGVKAYIVKKILQLFNAKLGYQDTYIRHTKRCD